MVISIHREPRGFVVDAANVGWGGSKCNDGFDIYRIISCRTLLISNHFPFVLAMHAPTYRYQIKYECTGHLELQKLLDEGELLLFEDDDEYILDLAVAKNYGIITNDTFEDTYKDGELVERQRSKYPHKNWSRIDELTWGTGRMGDRVRPNEDWRVIGSDFLSPKLKPLGEPISDSDFEIMYALSHSFDTLNDLGKTISNHPNPNAAIVEDVRGLCFEYINAAENLMKKHANSVPDKDELGKMTVKNLRELCENMGLKKSGNKPDLIERISCSNP